MDFSSVDLTMAIDVFLLLLIGIGPQYRARPVSGVERKDG